MTVQERIDAVKEKANSEAAGYAILIAFLEANRERLELIGVTPSIYGLAMIDFDNCTRTETLAVIKAFPGKWNKGLNYNGTTMDYTRQRLPDEPITLRIWAAELPPSCKVVKKLVTVPQHVEEKLVVECFKANGEPALEQDSETAAA